ncbi:methyltransferase domain-containing protein [Bacillus sp. V3B]|uniref:class I SAM-dependent methyltransferase n=1 Tax=Bacillus sp. V3B TaxID=2804915 RepID=UPI00210EFE39|nr:methyltransferase domain-containing protein [Bacillus sp. V3B]MCQ6276340.1 methyltransferase domain-containing protein [Bacillus sp. V3B]
MDPKRKWNSKYSDRLHHLDEPAPNIRLKNLSAYLNGGSAFDLACGLGGNSLFLAQLNYQVQAFDISDVAVDFLKNQAVKKQLSIHTHLCDLTEWHKLNLNKASFDLVVVTYYLDRSIFPFIKSVIKDNGYFFMETYYLSPQNEDQGVSNQYKLRSKELLSVFGDWKVLYYEENEQEGWQTIFCQKCSSRL